MAATGFPSNSIITECEIRKVCPVNVARKQKPLRRRVWWWSRLVSNQRPSACEGYGQPFPLVAGMAPRAVTCGFTLCGAPPAGPYVSCLCHIGRGVCPPHRNRPRSGDGIGACFGVVRNRVSPCPCRMRNPARCPPAVRCRRGPACPPHRCPSARRWDRGSRRGIRRRNRRG